MTVILMAVQTYALCRLGQNKMKHSVPVSALNKFVVITVCLAGQGRSHVYIERRHKNI